MSSVIIKSVTSVRLLEANEEQTDQNTDNLIPAIRFFGSVDPIKIFVPRTLGFYPVFRGDLLALRVQENDLVFFCEREIKAYCKEQHIDFLSFGQASMLHAVQYKELRVWLFNVKKDFLNAMDKLTLGSIVHVKMQEVSSIPVEAILRCKVAVKTPQCSCDNLLFGVELKEHRGCGDSDGTILGQRLFVCEHNCGVFVSIEQLVDFSIDDSLYKSALNEKSAPTSLIKMTFVGVEGAGKTSLIRTLLGKPFQGDEASTIGAYFTKAMSSFIKNTYRNSDDNITYSRSHCLEWREIRFPEVNLLIHNQFNRRLSDAFEKHKKLSGSNDHNDEIENPMELSAETKSLGSFTELRETDGVGNNVFATEQRLRDLEVSVSSKDLREATYGIKTGDQIRFVLSDYGGHLIFHNFHLLFTSEDDVISITVDASYGLDSPVIPRERCDYSKQKRTAAGMLTPLQTIHLWLQSIHARATKPQDSDNPGISRIYPTVLIVATHVPWFFFQKLQFIRKIRATLVDKPYAQHLPENDEYAFHFVDNKHRWLFRSGIFKLKDILLLSASRLLQKTHPVCYLKFEEAILKEVEGKKEKLTLLETLEIAVSCGITDKRDVNNNDFLVALVHFTKKGVLLYYPDIPALRDTVFISPQWLADVFSSIITTHKLVKEGDPFRQAWLKYDKYGILEEGFLDHILKKSNNFENKDVILGLFEKFNLGVEIPSSTRFTGTSYSVDNTGHAYIVPSLLIDDPSYRERFDAASYQTDSDSVSLAFYFPDKFLPETTMNQLLVKCIQWNVEKGYQLERILYGYGHYRLGGNQFYWLKTVQLSDDCFNSTIYLIISNIEPSVSLDEQSQNFLLRQELLRYLTESLDEITNVSMPTATKPVIHVVCPHCSGPKIIEPHLPIHDIIPDGPLVCSKTGQVIAKKHYSCILRNPIHPIKRESRSSVQLLSSPLVHQPVGNQFSLNSVSHDSVTSHEQLKTDHASNNSTMLRAGIYEIPSHTSHIPSFSIVEQKVTITVVPLIAPSLAGNWERIAIVLGIGGEDNTGEIDTIKKMYNAEPNKCFLEVFQKWISGCSGKSPKTWGTVKDVLIQLDINFSQNVEQKLSDYYKRKGHSTDQQPQGDKVTMTKVPLLSQLLAPHWISIGYLLDLDDYGFAVQCIKSGNAKPEDCFSNIVKQWISGNKGVEPKTWQKFIQVLEDIKLNVDEIRNIIFS